MVNGLTVQPFNPSTLQSSTHPIIYPSNHSTIQPSNPPTIQPSNPPTIQPSNPPTIQPSPHPTLHKMSTLKFNESTPEIVRRGLERRIISTSNLMTVIVDFTDGPWAEAEPFHSHPHEQTGYLIKGSIRLSIGTESYNAQAGDSWCIPGGIEHGAEILEDSIAIEVFSPVRNDYLPGRM